MIIGTLLEFARGPLFVGAFLFMVLGLLRLVVLQLIYMSNSYSKTLDHNIPWSKIFKDFASWTFPSRNTVRMSPVMSIFSIVFHIGLLLVPLFFGSHILLWERGLGLNLVGWLEMGIPMADILTVTTIVSGLFLLCIRIFQTRARFMSSPMDYLLLVALLVPFISGFLAVHPAMLPISYSAMMLIHILSAELVFILIPFSKLAHVVLFPFDRISSDFYWKLSTEGAEKVAHIMRGEDLKV